MKSICIAVAAGDETFASLGHPAGIEWVRVRQFADFSEIPGADLFLFLEDESLIPERIDLPAPLIANMVTKTLSEVKCSGEVCRINGWRGFLQRDVWELSGETDEVTEKAIGSLGKKIIKVADTPGFVTARIIAMIINEAYYGFDEGISSKNDIDTAMRLGTNYPFGPFEWAEEIGIPKIYALLERLSKENPLYKPSPALVREAKMTHEPDTTH